MRTYTERSMELAVDASIAVLVLMGEPNDVEFVPIKPRAADDAMLADLRSRWPGRGLRSVGVIGLIGARPKCALKEPLEPEQTSALAVAFLAYLQVLIGDSLAARIAELEVAELRRHLFAPGYPPELVALAFAIRHSHSIKGCCPG